MAYHEEHFGQIRALLHQHDRQHLGEAITSQIAPLLNTPAFEQVIFPYIEQVLARMPHVDIELPMSWWPLLAHDDPVLRIINAVTLTNATQLDALLDHPLSLSIKRIDIKCEMSKIRRRQLLEHPMWSNIMHLGIGKTNITTVLLKHITSGQFELDALTIEDPHRQTMEVYNALCHPMMAQLKTLCLHHGAVRDLHFLVKHDWTNLQSLTCRSASRGRMTMLDADALSWARLHDAVLPNLTHMHLQARHFTSLPQSVELPQLQHLHLTRLGRRQPDVAFERLMTWRLPALERLLLQGLMSHDYDQLHAMVTRFNPTDQLHVAGQIIWPTHSDLFLRDAPKHINLARNPLGDTFLQHLSRCQWTTYDHEIDLRSCHLQDPQILREFAYSDTAKRLRHFSIQHNNYHPKDLEALRLEPLPDVIQLALTRA